MVIYLHTYLHPICFGKRSSRLNARSSRQEGKYLEVMGGGSGVVSQLKAILRPEMITFDEQSTFYMNCAVHIPAEGTPWALYRAQVKPVDP